MHLGLPRRVEAARLVLLSGSYPRTWVAYSDALPLLERDRGIGEPYVQNPRVELQGFDQMATTPARWMAQAAGPSRRAEEAKKTQVDRACAVAFISSRQSKSWKINRDVKSGRYRGGNQGAPYAPSNRSCSPGRRGGEKVSLRHRNKLVKTPARPFDHSIDPPNDLSFIPITPWMPGWCGIRKGWAFFFLFL